MNYENFLVEEFIQDKYFQQWVLSEDPSTNLFWINWLKNNEEKREIVEEAKQAILVLGFTKDVDSNERFISSWEKVDEEWDKQYGLRGN